MNAKIVVFLLVLVFIAGCGPESRRDQLLSRLNQPEVQTYINTWVKQNVVDDVTWRQSAVYSYARGLGAYHLDLPEFDWATLGADPLRGRFKLMGSPDEPKHLVFVGIGGRRAVVYSLHEGSPVDGVVVCSNEVVFVTEHLYLFDPEDSG